MPHINGYCGHRTSVSLIFLKNMAYELKGTEGRNYIVDVWTDELKVNRREELHRCIFDAAKLMNLEFQISASP